MTDTTTPYRAEHTTLLDAPAETAYGIVADVTRWPLFFQPCVHARVLEQEPGAERIQLWALTGDTVRSWTSRRTFDETALKVTFRQENSAPPLASMNGDWRFERSADGTRLVLGHDWTLTDETSGRWVTDTLDRNSTAEIGAVKVWSERPHPLTDLLFTFTDEVDIPGPAEEVYAFLHRADLWPERLPHVARLGLTTVPASDATAGAEVQTLEMDTRTADGSVHTTRSVRLCFPHERIVYKQTTVPRALLAHSGEWLLTGSPDGTTRVTARHSVALDPDGIEAHFGSGTTLPEARAAVRAALGGNSRRTLEEAREHVAGVRS